MNRQMLGLLGTLLFFVVLCAPAWATDMVWAPRTPAGGGYIDSDHYARMINWVEHGLDTVSVVESINKCWIGNGYWKEGDDGRINYFYKNGEKANLSEVNIEFNENNQKYPIQFFEPSRTVTTVK